jgi:hypothetical protein
MRHSLSGYSVLDLTLRAFLVSRGFVHARGIGPHAGFEFRSSVFYGCVTVLKIVRYGACAPPDSKMGTEVVGMLTHADAPQWGGRPA